MFVCCITENVTYMSSYKLRGILLPLVVRTRMYKLPDRWLKGFNIYPIWYQTASKWILFKTKESKCLFCGVSSFRSGCVLNLNVIYMLFEFCAAMYKVITIINNSLQWPNKTIRRQHLHNVPQKNLLLQIQKSKTWQHQSYQGIFLKQDNNLPLFFIKHGHFEIFVLQ